MRGTRRAGPGLALILALGCAKGDNQASSLGPAPWELPDSEAEPTAGTRPAEPTSAADGTGSASGGPASTSGEGTTSGMPPAGSSEGDTSGTTSGASTGGTFGDDDGNQGMQPASGWWSHCIPNVIACSAGFSCLSTDAGDDGVCTQLCAPAGNPGSCGASPGGSNVPTCLSVQGNSICALSCEGGLSCPGGMVCVAETDDTGPISICL